MRRTLSAFVALAVLHGAAPATAAAQQATDSARATAATPATPGAIAAADELLRLMNTERVMRSGMTTMLDASMAQQPAMMQFRDVMLAWADKFMTWKEVGPDFVRIYTDIFTEAELRSMVDFYRTPVGKKVAERTPEIAQRGAEVGAALAARHMGELQQMIQARMAELQAQQGKAP